MTSRLLGFLFLTALALGIWPELSWAQDYPKLAPYTGIRWTPEVKIDGKWYALRSINDLPVGRIVEFARKKYDDRWQKRFDEDLVQVLTEMGHSPGATVSLLVVDIETGMQTTLDKVPLTAENRRSIYNFKYANESRAVPIFGLKPENLRSALDAFQAALDDRWSYRHANRADFDTAVAVLRKKVDSGISPNDFGVELQKIIALGIDAHASVSGYHLLSAGYLPFLVEPEGDRFVAFKPDRTGFLLAGFPYLRKIDGIDVADWCQAATVLVPKGSPQYVRRHCLRHLRRLDYLRELMRLPKKNTLKIELADKDDRAHKTLSLRTVTRSQLYGMWPCGGSRLLEGNIGYLRLADMDSKAGSEIQEWMPKFRDTAGLIVDATAIGIVGRW